MFDSSFLISHSTVISSPSWSRMTFSVECEIKKEESNIGRVLYNEHQRRFFWNIDADKLSRNAVLEIIEAVSQLLLELVPEIQEEQNEGTAE